ncbi:hypothetical protein CEF21_21055 [Bacillus sp. FJAT-42376]|uniref:hypothetical protein n=1 Tax=Bacillus sp. FJAT-42376 TaxID=2014076 RepID=UPI000F4F64E4|nr:hypothetical protein [Bacillus sp. FJAT-42376]AZB44572.1 hypothetical protein CEF21_21055 [Bacillus sp. FJAT-42376]
MKLMRMCFSALLLISLLAFPASATEGPYKNLGPQVQYVNVIRGEAGMDQYGRPLYYALLQGEPAKLVVIDLQSKQVVDMETLEGATAAWSIEVDSNRQVWIGSTPNEQLYRYNPETRELSDLGKASAPRGSNTTIWDLTYDTKNNRIFGVTSYGGTVFTYSDDDGFDSLGVVMNGRRYARSVEYDEEQNTLYVGLGSPAALIKWNLNTNEKTDILPEDFKSAASVYDLDLSGGKVYAKMENKSALLVLNQETDMLEHVLPADSRGVSPAWNNQTVFYSSKGKLFEFNPADGSSRETNGSVASSSAVSLDILNVNGQPQVVGLAGNAGRFYQYNLLDNRSSTSSLKLPAQPVEIYNVGKGVNGNIYSSGFISGRLGIYNPRTETTQMFEGLGQVEDMTSLKEKMFFGVYPNGLVYEYDTQQAWNAGSNPKKIMDLGASGQDRPNALAADEGKNRLYAGTVPKRGEKAGMFLVYDGGSQSVAHEETLPDDQSASSMTFNQAANTLYLGTSAYDGSGNLSPKSAKLYAIDTNSSSFAKREIELPGGYAIKISALKMTNDGRLWGIVDNKLLVYDPEKGMPSLYPITPNQIEGMYRNESLVIHPSGDLYGTFQGMLFKVDTKTLEITCYSEGNVFHLAGDQEGNLYFNKRSNLWKINPNDLTAEHVYNPKELKIPNISTEDSPFPVARVYSRQSLLMYKKEGNSMVPVKEVPKGAFYRVYGTYKSYYHVGNGYYFYNEPHRISTYIGRVFTLGEAEMLKPDGSFHRMIKPDEEIRVYNYDNEKYDVGNGYTIMKNSDVTYKVGIANLKADSMMFRYGSVIPEMKIYDGEEYVVYNIDGNKLDIGNGFYLEFNKGTMEFTKN